MHQFGPMASSPDGIDRLELRVPMRVSRDQIVTIAAYCFETYERITKPGLHESVIIMLAHVGLDGIETLKDQGGITDYDWTQRYAHADEAVSKLFSGWS